MSSPPATAGPASLLSSSAMQRQLRAIAITIAVLVAVLIPAVGTTSAYLSQASILRTEAEINSRLVSQLVQVNPELWRVETHRLETLLARRPGDRTPEVRSVHEPDGRVIAAWRDPIEGPFMIRKAQVHDAGVPVAELRIQRSLRPQILQGAWLGMLGLVLGAATFAAMQTLPLRALRRAHEALLRAATRDALTGLPNRAVLMDHVRRALDEARSSRRIVGLIHLDLHRFKSVNDRLGHAAGDRVIVEVARTLETVSIAMHESARHESARRGEPRLEAARLTGDEFAVMVDGAASVDALRLFAERMLRSLDLPMTIDGRSVHLSGSIGIAHNGGDHGEGNVADAEDLLKQAGMALERAKTIGRNGVQFFDAELQKRELARIDLEQDLRGALARGEFLLHYQPKAKLDEGRIEGFEALLRWQRPGHGLVPPDRFIPALEDNRLIHEVGAWVIETACAQLAAWDRQGIPRLSMAVNLSAHQFRDPALPAIVEQALRASGIAAGRLELELTESLLMDDSDASRQVLNRLYDVGVRFAIDDFGTGHSSLAYLKRFRINTLKIDRTFVRGLPANADNRAICGAMVALAHKLDLQVVCEGVEDREQLDYLRTIECDAVQGFHLARPMPAHDVGPWLMQRVAGRDGTGTEANSGARVADAARDPATLVQAVDLAM